MERQRWKQGGRIQGGRIFWWGLFLITVWMVWAVQRKIPFMMDDIWYSTLLYSDEPVNSIGDIISAQIWHYQNWGGRSVTHTMLQMVLCMGEPFADILNTLAVLLLSGLICVIAGKKSLPFAVITAGLLHGMNANWKMSMYWQAGACNYLYITIFILLFLLCYLRTLEDTETQTKKDPAGIPFYIIPLGLAAGWSNENMGPAVWLVTLGVILWRRHKKLQVKAWMILGNLSCLLGSVAMIIAPGNYVRSEEAAANDRSLLWNFFLRCYGESKGLFDYLFPVIVLTAVAVFVNLCILGEKLSRQNIALLAGAVLSWGSMILSPHYPDRAAFGTMVLLLCVILSEAANILRRRTDKTASCAMAAVGLLLWLKGMYFLGEYLALAWGWIV